jgi:E3 ubiquitin-protein ligase SHPRH
MSLGCSQRQHWRLGTVLVPTTTGAPPPAGEADVLVRGSYGTKLEAVVRRVLHLLAAGPQEERVLVFSSWADALELLVHALAANRVPFVHSRGGGKGLQEALARFKGSLLPPGEVELEEGPGRGRGQGGLGDLQGLRGPGGGEGGGECGKGLPGGGAGAGEAAAGAAGAAGAAAGSGAGGSSAGTSAAGISSAAAGASEAGTAAGTTAGAAPRGPTKMPSLPGLLAPGHLGSKARRGRGRRRRHAPLAPTSAGGPPRVLLLLLGQGGKGLNLTEAQHVVLLEPILDPAMEAQAIGRVHRIGQRKETHVHR